MSQSEHLHSIPDDPRLTAYVLDELSAEERAEVDQLIAASPEVRAAVDEIRETVGELNAAYDIDALRELEHAEPGSVAIVDSDTTTFTAVANTTHARQRMSRRAVLSLAGTVVAASLLVVIMATDRRPTKKLDGVATVPAREAGHSPTRWNASGVEATVAQNDTSLGVPEVKVVDELPGLVADYTESAGKPGVVADSEVRAGTPLNSHTVRNLASTSTPAPVEKGVIVTDSRPSISRFSTATVVTPPTGGPVDHLSTGTTPALGTEQFGETRNYATFGLESKLHSVQPPNANGDPSVHLYYEAAPGQARTWAWGDQKLGWSAAEIAPGTDKGYAYIVPEAVPTPRIMVRGENEEAYAPIVENDFLAPTTAPLSTFGVDVDSASYSNLRRFLTQNQLPPANAVRIEELLNYFKYNDAAPQGDKPFSVGLEAAACPWNQDHILVRVGLKGKEIHRKERPASNLVFLVDVSGSMRDDNKLPLVKSGLELLVGELSETDRVAIVTYAGNAGVALESTPGQEKSKILQMIQGLNAGGSTNGEGGLRLAYEQATKNFVKGGSNRVILLTDGDFNVGVSGDDELVQIIGQQAKSGVYLSVFGFGMGNLKDSKLEKIADKGNGHYGYVDSIREAQKVFVEEMTGTLYTIAKDVKVQVEFNPARVGAYRLIGYENRIMPAEDFRNDAKDSGDIGAGHSVTALYEIIPTGKLPNKKPLKYQPTADATAPAVPNNSPELLTLSLRYKNPQNEPGKQPAPGVTTPAESAEKSVQEDYPLAAPSDATAKTSDDFRWASSVAAFGMLLRNSAHKGNADFRMVTDLANGSVGGSDDPKAAQTAEYSRRREFVTLVEAAKRLRGEQPKPPANDDAPKR